MSSAHALAAAQYVCMAEELESMAVTIGQGAPASHTYPGLNFSEPYVPERLALLARQLREDAARLAAVPGSVSEHPA